MLVPPIVGAVVGGVGAILVLVVAFLVFTYYSNRPRLQHLSGKCDAQPRLTSVYAGDKGNGGNDDTHVSSKSANPDVVRGTGEADVTDIDVCMYVCTYKIYLFSFHSYKRF